MNFLKNVLLMSALSFVITSNAFAKTILITTDNFDWKTTKQTQKVSVTKAPVNKVIVTKAPVNKVYVTKAPVNKVIVTKAPVNKVILTKAPVNKVIVTKAPENKVPYITAAENKVPETDYQEAQLEPTIAPLFTPFKYEEKIDSPDLSDLDIDSQDFKNYRVSNFEVPTSVPVPAAVWLLGSALIGFVSFSKRRKN